LRWSSHLWAIFRKCFTFVICWTDVCYGHRRSSSWRYSHNQNACGWLALSEVTACLLCKPFKPPAALVHW
jgi:hypothetical protein